MEFFRKTTIGILGGLALLIAVLFGIHRMDAVTTTRALTIQNTQEITIDSRLTASQPMLIAPYKEMDVFISEEQSAGFDFTSVGGSWEEISPEGTNVEAEVRFKSDGKWTEWMPLEEEEDLVQDYEDPSGAVRKYATASGNPAQAMQYKFIMYGDGTSKPTVKHAQWTFIKTGKEMSFTSSPAPKYSAMGTPAAASQLGIVTRSGWSANESYRYMDDNNIEPDLVEIDPEVYEKYKDELTYSRVVEKDASGNVYKWPLQYPEKVKKFIIHHTATTSNLDNPTQAIRDIYYYHAITRGWGDIGYNYIIDQNGKIYEGRSGGEGVIGAHAGIGNNGSIGIAILGNFEEKEVPQKVMASLGTLIAEKAKIHGIDPTAYSLFRGQLMPNVFGHKDIMNTTCPGVYLYEKLPIIRKLAAEYVQEKPKFVLDYDYQDRSGLYYMDLKPDETVDIIIKLENIGKLDWNSSTFIVVDEDSAFNGVISFPGSGAERLAEMEESLVKPGETATFKFKIKGGKKSDTVYMNIAPLMNGTKKSRDYVVVPVAVQQSDFKYQLIDSKYPPKSMNGGESFTAWVKLKNTGNTTWRKSGDNTISLGTDHDRDRVSLFVPKSSFPKTRIGMLQEDSVAPGETGTFVMNLVSPEQAGYYKEYFTPVIEGVTWMADSGMYFETTVFGDTYAAQLEKISASADWQQGEKYLVYIKLRNLGQETWSSSNFKIIFLKEGDLGIEGAQLLTKSVAPGELGTISFVAKVSDTEDLERKSLLLRPMINGNHLLSRPVYVYYTVIENESLKNLQALQEKWAAQPAPAPSTSAAPSTLPDTAASEEEGDVRVRISFSGDPQITAKGSFEIYNGTTLLGILNAGELAKVTVSNGKYSIKTPKTTYSASNPVRFVPRASAILRIDNYENRPAWDTSLNDNEYRGILEVREVDGELAVINELPLEDYLKGLGEVPNYEAMEKIKSIMVAARTYAKYYMDIDEKFPGKPYDLNDDPNVCQKYIGYGFEKRAPNIVSAVTGTEGQVVTYNGEIVKTPYFSQSDGTKTRSALDVWNWDAPYLVSVSDSYCNGDKFLGHGVGLSGCGAKGMAEKGYGYVDILKHYYTGVEIADLY
ncbi:MAG: SpoIID/LytB domain-containing protein [Candidatus Peregrinibacteria bacterium]